MGFAPHTSVLRPCLCILDYLPPWGWRLLRLTPPAGSNEGHAPVATALKLDAVPVLLREELPHRGDAHHRRVGEDGEVRLGRESVGHLLPGLRGQHHGRATHGTGRVVGGGRVLDGRSVLAHAYSIATPGTNASPLHGFSYVRMRLSRAEIFAILADLALTPRQFHGILQIGSFPALSIPNKKKPLQHGRGDRVVRCTLRLGRE